jgi:hypothetical protein
MSEQHARLAEERRDWLEARRTEHQQGTAWWVDTAYDLLDECDALAAEIEQLRELNNTLGAAADTLGAAAADVGQLRDAVRVGREALERIGYEQHARTALDFATAIKIARAALARLPAVPVEEQADERPPWQSLLRAPRIPRRHEVSADGGLPTNARDNRA